MLQWLHYSKSAEYKTVIGSCIYIDLGFLPSLLKSHSRKFLSLLSIIQYVYCDGIYVVNIQADRFDWGLYDLIILEWWALFSSGISELLPNWIRLAQMGQIWDFLRLVSVHFGSASTFLDRMNFFLSWFVQCSLKMA